MSDTKITKYGLRSQGDFNLGDTKLMQTENDFYESVENQEKLYHTNTTNTANTIGVQGKLKEDWASQGIGPWMDADTWEEQGIPDKVLRQE